MRADLHLHSNASDGCLSPQELVERAVREELDVISITDHDSVDGIAPALEAARAFPQLQVIPGVEINTDIPRGEVHVLGYFIDHTNPQLEGPLARLRDGRRNRGRKMVARLRDLGIGIEWERVQELAGDSSVGRPHVARAMLERGYISFIKEAFDKYIGREGPAYVEREKLTPQGAVGLVVGVGGLAVLAHPANVESLSSLLPQLISAGLVGLEVYYDGYAPDVCQRLQALAREHGLIATGGSDFHGLDSTETPIGGVDVPGEGVERLLARAERPPIGSFPFP